MSIRILINCELAPGTKAGGTQSVVSGLVRSLGELEGPEEYVLICHPENRGWIEPLAGSNTRLVDRPQRRQSAGLRKLQAWIGRQFRNLTGEQLRRWPEVPRSDGFYESLGVQVIHWPWQHFVVCAIPSIFNPHDLLHLHFPQFFAVRDLLAREALYPIACRMAQAIPVSSEWTKHDLMEKYGLHHSKIQVIPWAPPTVAADSPSSETFTAVRQKFNLPQTFCYYPAVTWEHKNHIRLLQALALLRDQRSVSVSLVCTGHQERYWPAVEAELRRLNLENQVSFLGSVSFAEVRAIYAAAQFVIVPTLFEAASGPIFEAWQEGVAAACSTVTSLPQQVHDAALLFDPYSVEAIADAIHTLATNGAKRAELIAAGSARLGDFSWHRTARAYRALYRRTACLALDREDRELLSWDWMKDRNPPSI